MSVEPRSLVVLSQGERMLAEARSLDDLKQVRDLALAAAHYARAQKLGRDAVTHAVEIAAVAARRMAELDPARQGERTDLSAAADKSGIPKQRRSENRDLLALSEEALREVVRAMSDPSLTGVRKEAREVEIGERHAADRAALRSRRLPSGKYSILLADPPWRYEFAETDSRGIENHYLTLDVAEIADYRDAAGRSVADLVADDAVLYLWATNPKLPEALEVLAAWGFRYVTNVVWIKDRIGMGYWARARHELVLIGVRGQFSPPPPAQRPDSVFMAPRGAHSVKPPAIHELVEAAWPAAPKVELFARRPRAGWAVFGNDAGIAP